MISLNKSSVYQPVLTGRHAAQLPEFQFLKDGMNADFEEMRQDIAELLQLCRQLLSKLASPGLEPQRKQDLSRQIQEIKKACRSRHDLLSRSKKWGTASDHAEAIARFRVDYLSAKQTLRRAFKELGMLLCLDDWQSPTYEASVPFAGNRLHDGIKEHILDYKRDGHLEAALYEKEFVSEYASHLGSDRIKAFLTSSGMSAFSTVLHFVLQESGLGSVACLLPMYFENIHLLRAFQPDLQVISHGSGDIVAQLEKCRPSVLVFDTLSNSADVIAHDLESIVSWAKKSNSLQALIIDATCTPLAFLPDGILEGLPEGISVFMIESLAKYHQYGMDIVTGGIVLMHASENAINEFKKCRARFGGNISDVSAASLPAPDRMLLSRRLRRHSRNAKFVAEQVEKLIEIKPGIFSAVSWQKEGMRGARWFASSCITLKFCPEYANLDSYREFEHELLKLASQRSHALAFSTSFGFDLSRSYITAPASVFEPPFLRLALGTENSSEVRALLSLIEDCSAALHLKWRQKRSGSVGKTASISVRKEADSVAEITGHSHSQEVPELSEASQTAQRVFLGEQALSNYLCPANYSPSPLVELPAALNPFKADGVRIMAKIVPAVPLMNIKSIPAYSMLSKAAERGDLDGVKRIIESSSSNTVLSLSVLARLFGIENTAAIVDHSIAPGLVRMLRLFGIEIFLHPSIGHELFGLMEPRSQRAAAMGAESGSYNPNQYANPDNPEGFSRWLAPELLKQSEGKLGLLACALGTCGTMVGLSRELRKELSGLKVLACCPQQGESVPGPRERSLLGDVAFDWQDIADARFELSACESFAASVELLRSGIMAGPSSGMNYAGLLKYLEGLKAAGGLEQMLDKNGELWSAFICCDTPLNHVDEYFEALGESFFPPVHQVPELSNANRN